MKYSRIIKIVSISIVVLGSLLIVSLSMNLFGYRLYVDESGSMQPKIQTGSVVLDHESSNYAVGNIVTYQLPNSQGSVTHRITKAVNLRIVS